MPEITTKPIPVITAKTLTLRNEHGYWLAQVVLTSDGMFSAVSDYGNFAFSWRSIGQRTFEEFLCELEPSYFAQKMQCGIAYQVKSTKQLEHACEVFAEKVLPALQEALRNDSK